MTVIPKNKREQLRVEIVDQVFLNDNQITEVFARVFNGNEQVGFGKDGTIDIERFRFIKNGFDFTTEPNVVEKIMDTMQVMQFVFSGENIVEGKIGNTTSTFYPSAGNVEPYDGDYRRTGVNETFSTIRAGAGTSGGDHSGAFENAPRLDGSATTDQFDGMYRAGFGFDTSAIPDTDTISAATLSLFDRVGNASAVDLGDTNAEITSFAPTSESSYSITDFDVSLYGSVKLATGLSIDAIRDTDAYADFVLNASGLAHISKTGNTYFGLRLGWDVDWTSGDTIDDLGGTWASGVNTLWACYFADEAATTRDPKLVVEHAAGGSDATPSMATQVITSSVVAASVVTDSPTIVSMGTVTVTASTVSPALELTSVSALNVGVLAISLGGVSVLTGGNISVGMVTQDLTASVISPTVTAETDGESTDVVVIMGTVSMVVSTVPRPVEGLVWNRIARTV